MEDKLGHEIKEGHLIFKVNTDVVGVVTGGQTSGGKIRFINHNGAKENADNYNIIIITEEQALPFLDKSHDNAQDSLREHEEANMTPTPWYADLLNKQTNAKEKLLTIHRETAPQRL